MTPSAYYYPIRKVRMEQQTIKTIIIKSVEELDLFDNSSIVALKGFDRWLDEIDGEFLFGKDISLSGEIDLANIIQKASSIQTRAFIKYEDLAMLSEKSLGGVFQGLGKKIVVIDNDFYNLFYPCIKDEDQCAVIKEQHASDSDNLVQRYYGDVEEYDDITYVAYNDIPGISFEEKKLSSLMPESIQLAGNSDKSIEIPEEYDSVVLSGIMTKIIEDNITSINILSEKSESDGNLVRIKKLLSPFGVQFAKRTFQTTSGEIDKEFYNNYLEILRRKNPNYSFRDIKIYENPYEGNELIDVNQVRIIDDIVQSSIHAMHEEPFRDVFVTAPTGAGKSVMFQIPAIYLAEKYDLVTIVVSPLIGLMNDQVTNITSMTNKAATINSDYTPTQKEDTLNALKSGEKSILYLSPEALLANTDICNLIGDRKIGLLVVDEAHIVATWGKSFRPDYWYLGDFINKLRNSPKSSYAFPIVTFTATSTFGGDDNMYQDIVESLRMTPIKYIGNVKRDDISFDIRCREKDHAYREEKLATAIESINNLANTGEKVLVYTPYTKHIGDLYRKLNNKDKIGQYYGGLDPAIKNDTLKQIVAGTKNVVLATKAFGMGIDIDDIKYVYHFAPTGNIPDYVQEIGRAARKPGMQGFAITDFYKEDFRYINQLYGMSSIKNYQIIGVLRKIYDLYTKYDKRNFMVSPEDFSYIFADLKLEDVDAKLKTTLLMIKKDFESDSSISYPPVIFKPRSMFTFGYFMIKDDYVQKLNQYGLLRYFEKLHLPRTIKQAGSGIGNGMVFATSPGDTYRVNFKKLWEERYRDMSFGAFKRAFMLNKLPNYDFHVNNEDCSDPQLYSRIVLTIDSKQNVLSSAKTQLFNFLDSIKDILDDLRQEGIYFGFEELSERIIKKGAVNKRYIAEVAASSIIRMIDRIDAKSFASLSFVDYNSQTGKMRIKNATYENRIYSIKKCANVFLSNHEDHVTTRYVGKTNATEIVIVQLLEILGAAECDMLSGTNPEFFIRVNNPYAIEKIINNPNYVSRTVSLVGQKHKESCQYMQYFFTELSNDTDRWDFIEKYFLGQIEPRIINQSKQITLASDEDADAKEPKRSNVPEVKIEDSPINRDQDFINRIKERWNIN